MSGPIKRRSFLKMMGATGVGGTLAGCDLPSTVTLEEGKEKVVSYFMPEEYVIPGVGVYFASTCQQCTAGCGVHGRVREGRILKIEGNPDSPVNKGKTCQMGQAGVQAHYNPDRIKEPMLREGGKLTTVSWEKAMAALKQKTDKAGSKIAWFSGTVSGHQSALIANYLDTVGAPKNHYKHEIVNSAVWQAVNQDMLGDSMPNLDFEKAALILSFGADFLGTWISPVHFAGKWSEFRSSDTGPGRGVLIQVESKMSLTGGSADLWVPTRPGSEGAFALGLANYILKTSPDAGNDLSDELKSHISSFDMATVAKLTGTSEDYIKRVGDALINRSPSLVLAGAPVEGHEHGYDAVAAIMLLNVMLGNIGKTILPSSPSPFEQLATKSGNTRDLIDFTNSVKAKEIDVAFFSGANPLYNSPDALGLKKALKENVGFTVAISSFPDDTTMHADLVLPLSSYMEDWGTHVPAYQNDGNVLSLQQPLMEKLNSNTKGLGDILIALLKDKDPEQYGAYPDYFAYLQDAVKTMQESSSVKGREASSKEFWNNTLQAGMINLEAESKEFSLNNVDIKVPADTSNDAYPYYLVPSPRMGLFDGRHANLPWLQESPDQIAKVVWKSWAEMHPVTAKKLGVERGDIIELSSEHGSLRVEVYTMKSIHPDAIAVPLGQGHENYGRYAKLRGVNPLKILAPKTDRKTGELAMYSTRVKATATGETVFVRRRGNDTQVGRKFVRTISVDLLKRTEGA